MSPFRSLSALPCVAAFSATAAAGGQTGVAGYQQASGWIKKALVMLH